MSGIAQILLSRGAQVSGSDVKDSQMLESLRARGARIYIGHRAEQIGGADVVVYSSAIKEDNPEFQEARRAGRALVKRAQVLAELMAEKNVITVAGSHGKTTTTSLVSYLLLEAGLSPTIAIGGMLKNIAANASHGEGDFFVAEADESDGSFLFYAPTYSIITNIDYEHLDYYGDFKTQLGAFKEFIHRTRHSGCVFLCSDDEHLVRIARDSPVRQVYFGLNKGADITAGNIEINGLSSAFDCLYGDTLVGRFELALGGRHNISNALSVIALALELKIDRSLIQHVLKTYKGAGRRLDIRLQTDDLTLIDDYAHHPTEIKATLAAVRYLRAPRVVAVFQPHRYTRTKLLLKEFGNCFDDADSVIVTDIYPASEPPIEGISGRSVSERILNAHPGKDVAYIPRAQLLEHLAAVLQPRDVVIMLGAGDITKYTHELAQRYSGRHTS